METPATQEEQFQKIVDKVKSENPGTEIWLGGHPRTEDKWIYRPGTPSEIESYRKLQAKAKETDQTMETSYVMLVLGGYGDDTPPGCVLWPPKKELKALLLRRPLLAATMAAEICDVSGMLNDTIQKKL